jgi:hypothetical protein
MATCRTPDTGSAVSELAVSNQHPIASKTPVKKGTAANACFADLIVCVMVYREMTVVARLSRSLQRNRNDIRAVRLARFATDRREAPQRFD